MVKRSARAALWWKRSSLPSKLVFFLLLSCLIASFVYVQLPDFQSELFSSNLLFFVLINFSIIGIAVLAFVIGRNIIKLIFDRQEGILGSKLRTKLVLAFVGLTLVPTAILFILASGLISSAMEGWFGRQVEEIVNSSIDVAKDHYNSFEDLSLRLTQDIKRALGQTSLSSRDGVELQRILEERRKAFGFYSLRLIGSTDRILAESINVTSVIEDFKEPPPRKEALAKVRSGGSIVSFEEEGSRQFVRTYLPVSLSDAAVALVATFRISPELSTALGEIVGSYDEYKKLSFYKQPLKSSYVLALALITGLILFAAIWFGFYLAREIAVPIQRLAEGTKEVAQGNYDVHIRLAGDDEIGFLITSFNAMTRDLKSTSAELEQRRVYLESILSNLAVGVIAIDPEHRVTIANQIAKQFFSGTLEGITIGQDIFKVVDPTLIEEVRTILKNAEVPVSDKNSMASHPIKIIVSGREMRVVCSAAKMTNSLGIDLGFVLIFEDVTDLSMAHQMAAWREVARRIAHEIKNPLTPIKLSAQRLEKIFQVDTGVHSEVKECAQTIVENVESIKRLANEFSNFARMPTAEFTACDLNGLISDTLEPFVEQNSQIIFQFIAARELPKVFLDQEQIRRLLMNILDNAIAAVVDNNPSDAPKIVIKTIYSPKQDRVALEISDNGMGIRPENKTRIFEPYFTTKQEGTGLGLAIVNSVVSDHRGTIRVYDNYPRGSKFVIEIPLKQESPPIFNSN